jgi:hypothetical protein
MEEEGDGVDRPAVAGFETRMGKDRFDALQAAPPDGFTGFRTLAGRGDFHADGFEAGLFRGHDEGRAV